MELFNGMSDDQTALLGCFAALLVTGTMMSLSYYVGRFFQRSQQSPEPTEPQTLRMPDPDVGPRQASQANAAVSQESPFAGPLERLRRRTFLLVVWKRTRQNLTSSCTMSGQPTRW